mgnify:CR=1 FL=1
MALHRPPRPPLPRMAPFALATLLPAGLLAGGAWMLAGTSDGAVAVEAAAFEQEVRQEEEIEGLLHGLTPNFLHSMAGERLSLALEMFFRAKSREQCQYEVRRNEEWQGKEAQSLQLVMAWRNVPKSGFFYHLGVGAPKGANHSPFFDVDERAMETGVRAQALLALDYLKSGE